MTERRSASLPRVFVSSVVDQFGQYRDAASRGIIAAGAEPILVNEDFPAQSASSRNACLDAIDSCDCLVIIVGERGGWKTPSGLLVVEEEFEHAQRRNIPVLVFIQETTRDADADQLVRRLSDYVDGRFRAVFHSQEELQAHVARAVRAAPLDKTSRHVMEPDLAKYYSSSRSQRSTSCTIRLVLVPERQEEVIDPIRIGSPEFIEQVYQAGHGSSVRLFNYSWPKSARVNGDALVIEQDDVNGRHDHEEYVRVSLDEAGIIVLDANVTGRVRRGGQFGMLDSMVVATEDAEAVLASAFRFVSALYDVLDPHKRHQRFYFNVGLLDLGYRRLERNPQPRTQMTMSMRGSEAVVSYDKARVISRITLHNPDSEIERAVALLIRRSTL